MPIEIYTIYQMEVEYLVLECDPSEYVQITTTLARNQAVKELLKFPNDISIVRERGAFSKGLTTAG
jgi:hypothetical protein